LAERVAKSAENAIRVPKLFLKGKGKPIRTGCRSERRNLCQFLKKKVVALKKSWLWKGPWGDRPGPGQSGGRGHVLEGPAKDGRGLGESPAGERGGWAVSEKTDQGTGEGGGGTLHQNKTGVEKKGGGAVWGVVKETCRC